MKTGLGIDAGGTSTRWCIAAEDGQTLATGAIEPISGHVHTDAARTRAQVLLHQLATATAGHPAPTHILAGITGLDAGTAAAAFYQQALAQAFSLAASAVVVENDMGVAYRAACAPGTGILVYSGTGSVGCHVTADGKPIRVGGRGFIIDDAGAGFWIVKEAVKALFRAEDISPGTGWSTPLGQSLAEGFGGTTWEHARLAIYAGDRGEVGAHAPRVAKAALSGDAVALHILDQAGRELAALGAALLTRLGPREVILSGGASTLHPIIWTAFTRALPGAAAVHRPHLDGAQAAAIAAVQITSA